MNQTRNAHVSVRIVNSTSGFLGWSATCHNLDIPPRSKLYGLEPYDLETVWSECLTSYINRLGWSHGVAPRTFVAQEIGPLLDAECWNDSSPLLTGAYHSSNALNLNGPGKLAVTWATILEQLTQSSHLRLLTSTWWFGNYPYQKHLRTSPAWCPACYAGLAPKR